MNENCILDVRGLSKRFGARVLFSDIALSLSEGSKVGLIARNGTGKSTLLSIIAGRESSDGGSVVFRTGTRVGYLEQQPPYDPAQAALEACFHHRPTDEEAVKAKQILTRLQITDLSQPMGQLSGGQRKRVALAGVLIGEPDLLILDEPTNHLDLEMTEWLEGYLAHKRQTLLMVTHDRYFLDRVCDRILELDDRQLYGYRGNYSYYLEKRQERVEARRAERQRAENLYRTELEWMRRMPQARGHKAKYREDAFRELQQTVSQRMEERQMRLGSGKVYIGSKIFECQYVSKKFGDEKVILSDFYYNFSRFEKMGIVGGNGTGKSTFIKMLLGLTPPDSGRFDVGDTVRWGYYSQDGMKISQDERVIDVITKRAEYIETSTGKLTATGLLERFLFSREEQYDYVYKLSGGQQRKLYLCTVLMDNPNFLILDEPTNDLDIPTLQVLEEYLADFAGCVIVVSHDRYFTDRVVDHLLVFRGGGRIDDFPGNYTQYREYMALRSKEEERAAAPQQERRDYHNDTRRRMSYKEKREYEQLSADIDRLEAEQREIEGQLCGSTLGVERITELSRRLPEVKAELDEKSMRWLELGEML